MTDIFLSYSRDDQATARRFAEAFEREGLTVWWDQTLKPGEAYDRVTEKALQDAKAVVVLWSRKSVESHWVRSEATQAQSNGTLVPVMIQPCKRPIMFELMHTAELTHWQGDPNDSAWRTFLGDVRQFVKKEGAAPSPAVVPPAAQKRRFGVGTVAGVVAVLLVVGCGVWVAGRSPKVAHKPEEARAAASSSASAEAKEVTLAVLPFADMSQAHDQEYYSDGLSEEILNQLAQIKDLAVTGRTSSFSFKGKNEDMRVIAQKLGVANLLEGSIRKNGDQLRIAAQLIDGKSGTHLWSQTYERKSKDVFAVQEEIAKDVAKALSIKLDVGDMPRAQGGTTNIEAYDKYLQARTLLSKDDIQKSADTIQLFQDAVDLDPTFARAWQGLHDALLASQSIRITASRLAVRKRAYAATARVVALVPGLWWAKAPLAFDRMYQRKWSEAEAAANAALATAPAADAFKAWGPVDFLEAVGRINEAVAYGERARKADPLSLATSAYLQELLNTAGRRTDALAEYERSKSLAGDHTGPELFQLWARVHELKGADPELIKSRFREAVSKDIIHMPLGTVLVDMFEDKAACRTAIRLAMDDTANQDAVRMTRLAYYARVFGEGDFVLPVMRKLVIDMGLGTALLWTIDIPGFRTDPDFKQILREVGLEAYFRSSGKWGDFCKPVGKDDFACH